MELTLKGSPKFISSSPSANFIWSLFTLGFRGILLPLNISRNPYLSFDFKPPLPPLIKVWSAARGRGSIIRLNLTPQMGPIAMITTVKTDLKRPVRLQCQFGRNLIFETIWMELGEEGVRCQEQLFCQITLSATNQTWALKSEPCDQYIIQKWISAL